MAHLLGTQNVGALAGSRKLLEGVTVGLDDGSRVGILGPNGAGKSTLLRIVAGTQEPDGGVVTRRDGVRVAVLTQTDTLNPEDTVIEAVHPGLEEYEWASDPAVRDIHAGLLADIAPACARRYPCRAASAAASRWPASSRPPPTSCAWTNPLTISTSRAWPGWPPT